MQQLISQTSIFSLENDMNMNILLRSNPRLLWHQGRRHHGISMALRSLFFSTNTLVTAPNDTLYDRIANAGDPTASIITVIDKWLGEGNLIERPDLQRSIKELHKQKRFTQALEISQWMSDHRPARYGYVLGDIGVRLDLISKVHGLEEAEKFYDSIPNHLRIDLYGSLLKCYAESEHSEKAEDLMQKMRGLGILTPLSYNQMLCLYSRMKKYEKLEILVQEMEGKGIKGNGFTFTVLLKTYAASSNTEQMEKLLMKMERDPSVSINWKDCVVAAKGYMKAGQTEKALTMLKQSEQLIKGNSRRYAYEILISLYADVGNKDEVYRLWNKNTEELCNSSYLRMISSLIKLDDLDGAERIWEEWLSKQTSFDIQIPNMMISGYSKNSLWKKAEALLNKIAESGMEPNANSWEHLATGYCISGQMVKAAEAIKRAISIHTPGWKLNVYALAACLDGLRGQGDMEAAEVLLKLVGEHCLVSPDLFGILQTCVKTGNLSAGVFDHMEDDDLTICGERPEIMEAKEATALNN